jgi:SAM-dependent methyltransferase
LLDVGCGDGKFLVLAQQMGWAVTGLEPDPSAASNTRAKGITVIEGDISALADHVACFDVITCSHVIEHVHDPVAVLQAMHRLLKPGGRLWIETPNINSFGHERYGEHWRGLEPPRHLVLFNVESLSKVLHTIGFHVDEADVNFFQVLFMNVTSQAIARAKEASNLSMFAGVSFSNAWSMMQAYWYPFRREYITLMAVK